MYAQGIQRSRLLNRNDWLRYHHTLLALDLLALAPLLKQFIFSLTLKVHRILPSILFSVVNPRM